MSDSRIAVSRNVQTNLVIILDAAGPTAIDLVEVANPLTGTPVTVLDSIGVALVFPVAMTQMPGNASVWFSPILSIDSVGEFVAEFDPDVGDNFNWLINVTGVGGLAIPAIQLCRIEDYVVGPQGTPLENVSVSARILGPPVVIGGAVASTDIITTTTDANGFFSFELIRNMTIDVIIPIVGYRRTLVVPDVAQANLFSIT